MGKGAAQLGKAVKGKSKEKKKGDKKGKSKETSAEKQLSDDIKMLEEYEKLNKLAEAQRLRLKKLQAQESYNTRLNKKLLNNVYRRYMRAEKVDQLRKEIEILAQNHERDVDRKDAIIQMLMKDLDDAEEQFQTAQRAHMDRMEKLIALHRHKLAVLQNEFERDLKALKLEFYTERDQIVSQHTREVKEMQAIVAAVEAEEQDKIQEAKQAHETEREEIRNKNLEGINELRINLENKIEDLEKQFDEAHTSYVKNTEQQNRHFKELKENDARMSLEIYEKKKKILRLQNQLHAWKKKIDYNYKECTARNEALREQKDTINKHCNALKARMQRFRQSEGKRLIELTVMARSAVQSIQSKLEQAERILMLAELSRKFETEKEKVLPFYESTVKPEQIQAAEQELAGGKTLPGVQEEGGSVDGVDEEYKLLQSTAYTEDGKPVQEWQHLDNFYKKYNKVLLDVLAIKQEKTRLQKENEDLRHILKQYLDGIAITEDVVDKENPLLIVNGRINLVEKDTPIGGMGGALTGHMPVKRARANVTIEASHVVQTYATHGVRPGV